MPKLTTTVGQLLANEALPEDLRNYGRRLDKAGVQNLLQEVAERYPDRYRDILHNLTDVGRDVAYSSGSQSFGIEHLKTSPPALAARKRIRAQMAQILQNPNTTPDAKSSQIIAATDAENSHLGKDILEYEGNMKNPLAEQVHSGARGNPMQLKRMLGGDMLYTDHRGNILPIPVLHSYSEGVTAPEYWAASFGARKGLTDTKLCLAAGTRVLLYDHRSRPIEEIRVGDWVMGSDTAGNMRPVRVLQVHVNGLRPCYHYRFRKGSSRRIEAGYTIDLIATEEHRVLAQLKFGRTGQNAGQSQYTPTPLPLAVARIQKNPRHNAFTAYPARGERRVYGIHEPLALLAGLMLGDGCMARSARGCYQFSCADSQLIADTKAYLAEHNLQLIPASGYSYVLAEIQRAKRKTVQVDGRNCFASGHVSPVKDRLRVMLGEKKAHEKHLPSDVGDWDDASVTALVAGLFATDGCIYLPKVGGCSISYTSTSYKLAAGLQRLLDLRLGIWTSLLQRLAAKAEGRHEQWTLIIRHPEAIRRFAERIPLVGKKCQKLAEGLQHLSLRSTQQEIGFKLLDRTFVGNLETYDLEVDHPDHLFVLDNGLVVHNSTQRAGYLNKIMNQVSHRMMVTSVDDEQEQPLDAPKRGLPVDVEDGDNEGALLSVEAGGYPRNTVLTPKILKDIQSQGVKHLLVRSPTVGGPADGGVYSRDVGVREQGRLSPLGSMPGMAAAQAFGEKVSQGMLSSKHSGGVKQGKTSVGGFKLINSLLQVPKQFPGGAAHAQQDGLVTGIEEAPAGGWFVSIDGHKHYAPAEEELVVKKGDRVEAGDVLSTGVPNPAEVVKHKGIGEGRRYFTEAFRQAFQDSGMSAHRRNVELLARGLIDHVEVTDPTEEHLPGDVLHYHLLERDYEPRPGARHTSPSQGVGRYLEQPVLHYTIGTQLKPSMSKMLDQHGVRQVLVHDDPPYFQPLMVRATASLEHDPDFLTQFFGANQKKNLLRAAHTGGTSNMGGSSFVPAMATGVTIGDQWPGIALRPSKGPEGQSDYDQRGWISRWLAEHSANK